MATTSNSNSDGIRIVVEFTQQGGNCLPPSLLEAFRTANWRAYLPTNDPTVTNLAPMRVSSLQDNIARVDNEGGIYVPGVTKIEVAEQTITLGIDTAPGTPIDMAFDVPGLPDLQNAINNINFDIQPPGSPVSIGPPRLTAGVLHYDIYRQNTGATPPYDVITVRGFGRFFVVPSASPTP